MQYDESDFAFLSRLCEHYGIFYFFTHGGGRDVAIFGDSRALFPAVDGSGTIVFRSVSGLANASQASVYTFSGRSTVVPRKVCLSDYDYRHPDLALKVEQTVDASGQGTVVDHGSNFRTLEEGRSLARVRAQELASRKLSFEGRSDGVHLAAGAMFSLGDHFRDDFNAEYLVTWIEHEATQAQARARRVQRLRPRDRLPQPLRVPAEERGRHGGRVPSRPKDAEAPRGRPVEARWSMPPERASAPSSIRAAATGSARNSTSTMRRAARRPARCDWPSPTAACTFPC